MPTVLPQKVRKFPQKIRKYPQKCANRDFFTDFFTAAVHECSKSHQIAAWGNETCYEWNGCMLQRIDSKIFWIFLHVSGFESLGSNHQHKLCEFGDAGVNPMAELSTLFSSAKVAEGGSQNCFKEFTFCWKRWHFRLNVSICPKVQKSQSYRIFCTLEGPGSIMIVIINQSWLYHSLVMMYNDVNDVCSFPLVLHLVLPYLEGHPPE